MNNYSGLKAPPDSRPIIQGNQNNWSAYPAPEFMQQTISRREVLGPTITPPRRGFVSPTSAILNIQNHSSMTNRPDVQPANECSSQSFSGMSSFEQRSGLPEVRHSPRIFRFPSNSTPRGLSPNDLVHAPVIMRTNTQSLQNHQNPTSNSRESSRIPIEQDSMVPTRFREVHGFNDTARTPASAVHSAPITTADQKPVKVQQIGDKTVMTSEDVRTTEDDTTETVIQRKIIRKYQLLPSMDRPPVSPTSGRRNPVSRDEFISRRMFNEEHHRQVSDVGPPTTNPPNPHSTRTSIPLDVRDQRMPIVPPSDPARPNQFLNRPQRIPRCSYMDRLSGVGSRALSQSNVNEVNTNNVRTQWTSENNLRNVRLPKQTPMYGTYSAHQEAMRQRNASNTETQRRISQTVYNESFQETVSLQPIGRGVQDLESGSTPGTLSRLHSNTGIPNKLGTISRPPAKKTAERRSSNIATTGRREATNRTSAPIRRPLAIQENPRANDQTRACSVGAGSRGTVSPAPPRQNYLGGRGGGGGLGTGQGQGQVYSARMTQNESHWQNSHAPFTGSLQAVHNGGHIDNFADNTMWTAQSFDVVQAFSPEEAQKRLIHKEPGHFMVCHNKANPNSYILVVRVPITIEDNQPVRTFVLNRVGNGGIHLQGEDQTVVYPSLATLIQDHSLHPGLLPIPLRLPLRAANSMGFIGERNFSTTDAYNADARNFSCDVLYLGSVDVFPLVGAAAIRRAVQSVLAQANNPKKGLTKKCETIVSCVADKNITICSTGGQIKRKVLPAKKMISCAYDPEQRVFNSIECRNRGVVDSLLFAIVVKNSHFTMTEHIAHVMCQLDPHQASSSLINFINENFIALRR